MSVGWSRGGDALFSGYQPPAAVRTQDVNGLLDRQGLQVGWKWILKGFTGTRSRKLSQVFIWIKRQSPYAPLLYYSIYLFLLYLTIHRNFFIEQKAVLNNKKKIHIINIGWKLLYCRTQDIIIIWCKPKLLVVQYLCLYLTNISVESEELITNKGERL
jgi:uncharacterized membrane protein YcgQ (UPF0703/DUF1980 family)